MEHQTDNIVDSRLATWRTAVEQELQSLVQQASEIRQLINNAKTETKKQFYSKKFKKVTSEVMQMVATMERLDVHAATLEQERSKTVQNDLVAAS